MQAGFWLPRVANVAARCAMLFRDAGVTEQSGWKMRGLGENREARCAERLLNELSEIAFSDSVVSWSI
jgi:hypothetical protein